MTMIAMILTGLMIFTGGSSQSKNVLCDGNDCNDFQGFDDFHGWVEQKLIKERYM